jgi:NADPH:quinone reductase-like Zn-dependent oxidoreductase
VKAVRAHAFGGVDAVIYEDVPKPAPGHGRVLIRVAAAGVGQWDAWVRTGKSAVPQPLTLTLGADLSGSIEQVGRDVAGFQPGEKVFGVSNARFTGAYAEYAVAEAGMIAVKPARLTDIEAASVPVVVGRTAQQMLFDHAGVRAGQTVAILGGAGNVGGYAVQLALLAGARVITTAQSPCRVDRCGQIAHPCRRDAQPVASPACARDAARRQAPGREDRARSVAPAAPAASYQTVILPRPIPP